MRDKVKAFFKKMKQGTVVLRINFLTALVTVLSMKAIAAVFTSKLGCFHAVWLSHESKDFFKELSVVTQSRHLVLTT